MELKWLALHDFVKMSLIEAFITTHNFDIICLSETFLDSNIDISDTRIDINVYSLLKADHPSNTWWCLYLLQKLFTRYQEN